MSPAVKTWHAIARGRVQGVGFREFCVDEAGALGVTGWVRNRLDGSVEALLQGEPQAVAELCARLRRGPPAARVDALELSLRGSEQPVFQRFERRPTT